uniref:(northern house mosquito) hypothetical protein n=1 Tax=Culex pipiens TaxID=7175 RepID=A0A8D8CLI8_CULPI
MSIVNVRAPKPESFKIGVGVVGRIIQLCHSPGAYQRPSFRLQWTIHKENCLIVSIPVAETDVLGGHADVGGVNEGIPFGVSCHRDASTARNFHGKHERFEDRNPSLGEYCLKLFRRGFSFRRTSYVSLQVGFVFSAVRYDNFMHSRVLKGPQGGR